MAAFNLTPETRPIPREVFAWLGLDPATVVDHLTGHRLSVGEDAAHLAPYAAVWLTVR